MSTSPPHGWLSYDSVAEVYRRVAVPWFAALARDLVAAVAPVEGGTVLDVGTGTGLTADAALVLVGRRGFVVGVDPSIGMLAQVSSHPRRAIVGAMAPGLPFADRAFDWVTANLVVSHLPDHDAGLTDMVRVLRSGGRLGCSAWADEPDAPDAPDAPDNDRPDADGVAATIRDRLGLDSKPPIDAVPWEDHFHDRANLQDALTRAGLVEVRIEERTYRWTFTAEEFLAGWGSRGRYVRSRAGEQRWQAYVAEASSALRERFDDRIRVVNTAWIATGTRP